MMTEDYQAAFTSLAQALEASCLIHDRQGEAQVLTQFGTLQYLAGANYKGPSDLTRAIELYRELGYPLGEAEALNTAGELSVAFGRVSEGRACHEKAREIAAAMQSMAEEARALEGIGRCHICDGKPGEGANALRQALVLYEKIGSSGAERVKQALHDQNN